MLIVPEPAYVNDGGRGNGAINMLIVPESAFPYYSRAPFRRRSGVHTTHRHPCYLPLVCLYRICGVAPCRTRYSTGSAALRWVPSRPGSGGLPRS